ncbi:MAG: alanine and proline-rich secreted protein Apa [Planctomycetaceae bacterium]|jgi:hypothetical protein|nr:alanine and proline-rich secreted protein Apa [Planctomycetaceae bacterium]
MLTKKILQIIPKPVWAVGFALEQTLRDATLAVFSFLILKRLQHTTLFSFLLISFVSTFAQTDTLNNSTIDVSVYQKIKPLIKENTFIVAYIDVDKIDLDGFIVGTSPLISQFSKIVEQKLRELIKQESSEEAKTEADPNAVPVDESKADPNTPPAAEPKAEPNTPPAAEPKADPNTPPVAEPKADPNTPPVAEPKTDPNTPPVAEPKTDPNTPPTDEPKADITLENTDAESDEQAAISPLNKKFWSSVDMSDIIRQTLGGGLDNLRASGIKEFYVLSTMEIIQQCPALIAVSGKVDLKPELRLQLESMGIYLLPERIGGFTIFAVVMPPKNQPPVVASEAADIDPNTADPNTAQPANPFEDNPAELAPAAIPNPNIPGVLNATENQPANDMIIKFQNVMNIFRRLKNQDREEIKSALHIQRNSPIRIVFAPSPAIKNMANMMAPLAVSSIPNTPDAIKESIKEPINNSLNVLNKLKSVSIGFIPEAIRLNFAIEFMTEQEAQDAYGLVVKSFNSAKNSVVDNMKKTNENITPEQITKTKKLIDNFMPQLRKHRILHSTTKKTIEKIIIPLAELTAEKIALIHTQLSEQIQEQMQEQTKEQTQEIQQNNNQQ